MSPNDTKMQRSPVAGSLQREVQQPCYSVFSGNQYSMKYSHEIIRASDNIEVLRKDFNGYLAALDQYHFHQDMCWLQCNDPGHYSILITHCQGELVASSVIRTVTLPVGGFNRHIVMNGPLYRDCDALTAHLDGMKDGAGSKLVETRISPPVSSSTKVAVSEALSAAGYQQVENPDGNYTETVTVDLRPGLDQVKSGFSSSLKRQLKKAGKGGAVIRSLEGREQLPGMLARLQTFYAARGIGCPAPEVLGCYLERQVLDAGEGAILETFYDDVPVAGIVLVRCGDRVIFSYGYRIDNPELSKIPLSHMLHFEGLRWASEQGCRVYDFGGFDSANSKGGNNRFKLGFSGSVQTVSNNYILRTRPVLSLAADVIGRLRRFIR